MNDWRLSPKFSKPLLEDFFGFFQLTLATKPLHTVRSAEYRIKRAGQQIQVTVSKKGSHSHHDEAFVWSADFAELGTSGLRLRLSVLFDPIGSPLNSN
jgi:hypothetical protein